MYGEEWDGQQDLTGWWLSEKIDGARAFWNGEKMITRHGSDIPCPRWFIEGLPLNTKLDGELWIGRGQYEDVIGLIYGEDDTLWKSARYVVFDLPSSKRTYEERMAELKGMKLPPHVQLVSPWKCKGNDDLMNALNAVVESGGEGLMAVEPRSLYAAGERTQRLLKVKIQDDDDVQVMEILPTGLHCLQYD